MREAWSPPMYLLRHELQQSAQEAMYAPQSETATPTVSPRGSRTTKSRMVMYCVRTKTPLMFKTVDQRNAGTMQLNISHQNDRRPWALHSMDFYDEDTGKMKCLMEIPVLACADACRLSIWKSMEIQAVASSIRSRSAMTIDLAGGVSDGKESYAIADSPHSISVLQRCTSVHSQPTQPRR